LFAAVAFAATPACAALGIFATVPEWGALAEELGGDNVKVYVATNALQDPHHVEAKPSLIARARTADLVVATGAELEIGWLPLVTRQAGNPKIQPGKPGYFEAAAHVPLLEKPARLDRSEGDVHVAGNPHVQTDPRNILRVAAPLAARLAELDPANAAVYAARAKQFGERWSFAASRKRRSRSRRSLTTKPRGKYSTSCWRVSAMRGAHSPSRSLSTQTTAPTSGATRATGLAQTPSPSGRGAA
jgi:zinc/manganese transport system substrate-binding protein